jgi:hypothetical protein
VPVRALTVADAVIVSAPETVAEAGAKVTDATPSVLVKAVVELSKPTEAFTENVTTTPESALPVLLLTVAATVAGVTEETVVEDRAIASTGAVAVVVLPVPVLLVVLVVLPPALQPASTANASAAAMVNHFFISRLRTYP